ncbi:TPA: helix-turn-helix transcriptional regulator [Klebsiella pneumoniae]|uniref:helix-turn-helix transcriptional regulator n=1 Tax=Klebsiella quasipneumoniae TaxID=1463165 RepID=UPI001299BA79|nr:helix-turn-helix transcriptional regulator [Klebsiella quasipneumoniae]MBW5929895.1 transcriptional regulator [Klebsiella michiganensis]HDF5681424.1 helix-turn-helix transcriptional regulator [Klebsiella variicola]HDK5663404.1 helix-turn-helix transcriptional regulator [Klebsiella pneumoniae]MRG01287.1 helix-turn-helix domain-containing protein [Klebsiella quasipneumoniae]HDZ9603487.1 helix-turn-helix transcriptional regulator [Klebsiella pneumoniae]
MLPIRLKKARLNAGLTQEQLGILVGIDESSASARMNQYEKGKHVPDFSLTKKIADLLNVPVSYFYTPEDDLAEMILVINQLDKKQRLLLFKKIVDGIISHE